MRRILIVDDHAVVRDGIKRIFDEQPVAAVFGEAVTPQEALNLVSEHEWDLVVLDISLQGGNGLEALKEMKKIHPKLRVLILSMHAEEQYARRAFKSGAAGYITKDSPRAEIVKAVNKVMSGERYVSSALAEKLIVSMQGDEDKPLHETLSDREFEVMRLIASGKTLKEIAEILSLSDKSISTYRMRILEKMKMKTNAELIRYVLQHGLID